MAKACSDKSGFLHVCLDPLVTILLIAKATRSVTAKLHKTSLLSNLGTTD